MAAEEQRNEKNSEVENNKIRINVETAIEEEGEETKRATVKGKKANQPRIDKAKRRYKTRSSDDMEKALSAYEDGRLKFNETCRVFNFPKPTFRSRLEGLNMHKKIERKKYLTKAMKDELVNHILELESRFFGVTTRDLCH
ncbi:hypothetical protein WA026_019419 [Henosepilachna vigintioctopunctata]|uniref:HTH psq-type domain-containing protein n=1 Tax=Henosepilachna vigintioctopunctata TaxID=420089 RepID=A0AAW1UEP6_9CUCU